MAGGVVFIGAAGVAATRAVCAETAEAEPCEFVAVTKTRTVEATSANVSVYTCAVAGMMSTQFTPDKSQRRHW